MAFHAIGRSLDAEGLVAVMARAAELAVVHRGHGYLVAAFFHFEQLGLDVTIGAFQSLVRVHLAIESHFALGAGKLHRLAWRNRHDVPDRKHQRRKCRKYSRELHFVNPLDWLAMKKSLPQHGGLWIGVAGEDSQAP